MVVLLFSGRCNFNQNKNKPEQKFDTIFIKIMIVLNNEKYHEICNFIRKYQGLAIDCEVALVKYFPDVPKLTLGKKPLILINNFAIKSCKIFKNFQFAFFC